MWNYKDDGLAQTDLFLLVLSLWSFDGNLKICFMRNWICFTAASIARNCRNINLFKYPFQIPRKKRSIDPAHHAPNPYLQVRNLTQRTSKSDLQNFRICPNIPPTLPHWAYDSDPPICRIWPIEFSKLIRRTYAYFLLTFRIWTSESDPPIRYRIPHLPYPFAGRAAPFDAEEGRSQEQLVALDYRLIGPTTVSPDPFYPNSEDKSTRASARFACELSEALGRVVITSFHQSIIPQHSRSHSIIPSRPFYGLYPSPRFHTFLSLPYPGYCSFRTLPG